MEKMENFTFGYLPKFSERFDRNFKIEFRVKNLFRKSMDRRHGGEDEQLDGS